MRLRHADSASNSRTPATAIRLPHRVHEFNTDANKPKNRVGTSVCQASVASEGSSGSGSSRSLKQALNSGNAALIERAAKDILQLHSENSAKPSRKPRLNPLVQDHVLRHLSLPTLTAVLSIIQPRALQLSTPAITSLTRRLLYLNHLEDVQDLLSLVQPHIISHLHRLRRTKPHSVSYTPPDIVRLAFLFLNSFLSVDQKGSISVFQALVDSGHIPSEAAIDSSSSQTLEQIICMSLVKASLYWNWNDISEDILSQLIQSTPTPDSFTLRHTTACLYTLLTSPSSNDLHRCFNLIQLLHPHAPVPDGLVRQFYDCAVDSDAPQVAEELYDFSRERTVLAAHSYPAPQGRALTWLMTHVAEKSKKEYLVRNLASDVVQGHLPVPVDHRAQFISTIAEKGLALPARALWERYSTGKDGSVLCGNSRVMLRLTNIFTSLARSKTLKLNNNSEEGNTTPNDTETQKVSDLHSFANHVVTKYKEHHEPWEKADHRVITSYARACFIIGKNTEGFEIFKILTKRLELPDLYDVNVALGAIAKQAPESAARVIESMVERGVKPDAVTLGTVLHHASVQKNTKVTEEMVRRAVEMKKINSDVKAFGALIRAVVEPREDDTQETRILKLQGAWELVRQFVENGTQTSTQLGKYLVSLAIEAGDAYLAFKFWDALLKESAEYDDEQQRRQRGAIQVLTLAQNMRAEISGPYTRMIINQLNKRG